MNDSFYADLQYKSENKVSFNLQNEGGASRTSVFQLTSLQRSTSIGNLKEEDSASLLIEDHWETMNCSHDHFGAIIVGIFFGSVVVIVLILGIIFLLHQRCILPERERKEMEGSLYKRQGSAVSHEHGYSTALNVENVDIQRWEPVTPKIEDVPCTLIPIDESLHVKSGSIGSGSGSIGS
ncbi:unnamed protein product [Ranitomeya imitator]|uniref:Uncharacterized protein n=1 Tax=Ranitomeya imitator TaxID=111125 RepID=A0ABN9MQM8_9NEOB|nr:unnamed protein product [Ranitomeya imitator]